jgi:hypothetical protein
MVSMTGSFEFVAGGRAYACHIEEPHLGRREAWWWFDVAGDPNRYAPFRAEVGDTEASVRSRVVEFYEDRLERRGWAWWQHRRAAQSPA